MILYEDTLQVPGKHDIKNSWWDAHGVTVVRTRFDGTHAVPVSFGDYYHEGSNVVVDSKRDIDDIAKNINGKEHNRFKNELVRARDAGYRLIVLVENRDNIKQLCDLTAWRNTHCAKCKTRLTANCNPNNTTEKCPRHGTRKPIQGPRLAKAMQTMGERYGVRFEFCTPQESAQRICELLGIEYEKDEK